MAELMVSYFKSEKEKVRVLVLSDSHGDVDGIIAIITRHIAEIDLVLFLGDGASDLIEVSYIFPELSFFAVVGNNDFEVNNVAQLKFPLEHLVCINDVKIYMTHGHIAHYKDVPEVVRKRALKQGAHVSLYGHLHIPIIDRKGTHLQLNPGSIRYPRAGNDATYALLDIDKIDVNAMFLNV